MPGDNNPRAIAKRLADLDREFRSLLRDAPWNNDHKPQEQANGSGDASDGTPRQSQFVAPPPGAVAHTGKAGNAKSKPSPWWEKWKPWERILGVLGVVSAVVYAGITYAQWSDLRANFQADQRAWIKLQDMKTPDGLDGDFVVVLSAVNVGKTPAFQSTVEFVVELVGRQSRPSFDFVWQHQGSVHDILFPGDSTGELLGFIGKHPTKLNPEQISALTSGAAYVAVFGVIRYRDRFGDHYTKFCRWKPYATGPGAYDAKECVSYNAVGDGPVPGEMQIAK